MFDDLKTILNVNESESENESVNENENESVNENENENKSGDRQYYKIKQTNDKIEWLNDYWYIEYYEDNKETNLRLFNLKLAHVFDDVDDNLFKEIFGFTSAELADKLINTKNKEENQMLINDIEINRDKIFEQEYGKYVIQSAHKRSDLLDAVKVIIKFNETIQPYLT